MYLRDPQLDGLKETLAKVRKAVHKLSPRELSLVRMADKYGSDAKKKGAARLAKVATISATQNAVGDQALARTIATLDARLPDEIKADFPAPAQVKMPGLPKWAPWAMGGGLVLLGAILYKRRGR